MTSWIAPGGVHSLDEPLAPSGRRAIRPLFPRRLPRSSARGQIADRCRRIAHAAILTGCVLAAVPVWAQQGIIEVASARHNFGIIQEGEVVRHDFTIFNTGEVPFSLVAVRPSCVCVEPEWDFETVEPGSQEAVRVHFDSEGQGGSFQHTISIETTAAPSRVDLFIHGRVEPRALARGDTLGALVFGSFRGSLPFVRSGDRLRHAILIKNISDRPIEISEARTDTGHVRVRLPQTELSPNEFMQITVSFDTSKMDRGAFGHLIELVTTDSFIPVKRITLVGLIR